MSDYVILVNNKDEEVGTMEKMEAHISGKLHRAFSVFVFNTKGELLLQQRAMDKYHSGGKWTNTCCSHPRTGETTILAARRRLKEEMGIACVLEHRFEFIYQAAVGHGLTEHEYDHVYFGSSDEIPVINKDEVASFNYMSMQAVKNSIRETPDKFTEWFRICFDRVLDEYKKVFSNAG